MSRIINDCDCVICKSRNIVIIKEKYQKILQLIKDFSKLEKYTDETIKNIVIIAPHSDPAFVEAWVIMKCRALLKEIGEL
jgi:hypothetical protein